MVTHFKQLKSNRTSYWIVIGLLCVAVIMGYGAAHYMETEGHWVTGMNNHVVWGLPHIFAIFLILAASGALNIASMGSVFGRQQYQPWARLSALLAICLLIAGLMVLVLDLGRPERLIVAMTYYNFKSIFAWNIFLYTGFIVVAIIYLWTMFERSLYRFSRWSGLAAFVWRFVLTSGTGAIFGFLVARQFFDAAMMIPIFIVLSLILGSTIFILVNVVSSYWGESAIELSMLQRLAKLLGVFIALELLLVTAFHVTNLYAAEHHGIEKFILIDGGIYTGLFWLGQVLTGGVLPLLLIYLSAFGRTLGGILTTCGLIIVGGLSQLYVTIIGGQAFPLILFPGKNVSSQFYDGVVAHYAPSVPELLLGVGGVALAIVLVLMLMRVLPFLPDRSREVRATNELVNGQV